MFNMGRIREKSHIILWLLLFFFVASMTVGGLVGGANILDKIFGGAQTDLYVGSIDGTDITHQEFQNEYNLQVRNQRNQSQTIDSRGYQNARNSAWNTIVDKTIQNELIESLELETISDEIYNFLLYSPPAQLQQQLTAQNYFADSSGTFLLDEYQNALKTGTYPNALESYWVVWENYLKDWLPVRKLQNIFNQTASISDHEIMNEFVKKNVKCSVDFIYVTTNNINDSLITVSDPEIAERYEEDKEELYSIDASIIVEYVLWSNDLAAVDSSLHSTYLDSISSESLRFAGEADFSTFANTVDSFKVKVDTAYVTQDYKNNSGLPFQMGVLRSAVRFAFDNPIATISDPLQSDNGLAVFHIIGDREPGFKLMSEVEDNIKRTIRREKKKDYAKSLLLEAYDGTDNLAEIAENSEWVTFDSDSSKAIGSAIKGLGRSNELSGVLRAMEVGDISEPLETFSSVGIVKMVSKDEFEEEGYLEEYDNIRDRLMTQKRNSVYSTWLSEYKKSLVIKDNRMLMY